MAVEIPSRNSSPTGGSSANPPANTENLAHLCLQLGDRHPESWHTAGRHAALSTARNATADGATPQRPPTAECRFQRSLRTTRHPDHRSRSNFGTALHRPTAVSARAGPPAARFAGSPFPNRRQPVRHDLAAWTRPGAHRPQVGVNSQGRLTGNPSVRTCGSRKPSTDSRPTLRAARHATAPDQRRQAIPRTSGRPLRAIQPMDRVAAIAAEEQPGEALTLWTRRAAHLPAE